MPLDKKIPVIWVGLTYLFMAGGDGNLPCMDGNLPCDIKGYSKTPIRPLLLPFHPRINLAALELGFGLIRMVLKYTFDISTYLNFEGKPGIREQATLGSDPA